MCRSFTVAFFFILTGWSAWAGNDPTLVAMFGKIVDADTQRPLEAQITYRLLPVGHTTGIRNFANDDGAYQLPLQPHRQYQLVVTADQYQTLRIIVQTDGQSQLTQDLLLRRVPQPGELVYLPQPLLFGRGKTTPDAETQKTLDELKILLDTYPSMKIRLEGHTDQGSARQLMKLSGERAESIKAYLVAEGVAKKRIKTKAFGNTRLLSQEDTFESRQQNRRVEVRVTEL